MFCIFQSNDYDDVGPPLDCSTTDLIKDDEWQIIDDNPDGTYDDVVTLCPINGSDSKQHVIKEASASTKNDDDLHSTMLNVIDASQLRRKLPPATSSDYSTLQNDYSSVDDEFEEQNLYDDVGLPSREHVNSLYVSSSTRLDSVSASSNNDKEESEWEDLDESTGNDKKINNNNWWW